MSLDRWINRGISAFMNTVPSFLYLLFLCAGITCALLSGFIEYLVFAELLKKVSIWIPILLATSLEVAKIFLAFYLKHVKNRNNEGPPKNKGLFTFLGGLRIALVIISFTFTLLFSFYNLHNPEYNTLLEEKGNQIRKQHDERVKDANEDFDKKMENSKSEVDYWSNRMDEERTSGIGQRYKDAQEEHKSATEEHETRRENYEGERRTQIENSRKARNEELAKLEESLQSSRGVQNRMLSAMLQVIFLGPNYPQEFYTVTILTLSILLTFALEGIIIGSHQILAMNHGAVFEDNLVYRTLEERQSQVLSKL